jgi:hypothetical protein
VSRFARIFYIVTKRVTVDQHAEPLRAHKYPIPKEAHCGVQIKVCLLRPSFSYHVVHHGKQIYDSTGNDVPKTADVLNFVGILTHEQQVFLSTTPAWF